MTAQDKYNSLQLTQRLSNRLIGEKKGLLFAKDLDNLIDALSTKYNVSTNDIKQLINHYTT